MQKTHVIDLNASEINRFWSKVAFTANDERCWNWLGSKARRGYGRLFIRRNKKGINLISPRVSYHLTFGNCPPDKIILHSCDNPSCVNPKHLSLGTNKENTHDMMSKGRGKGQFPFGEKHHSCKLTNQDVIAIRKLYSDGEKQSYIARMYKVDSSLISRIVRKEYWPHI